MTSLFSEPLHGIACSPFCGPEKDKVRFKVNLSFGRVSPDPDGVAEPLWIMQDQGERYTSQVELFKGNGKGTNDTFYLKIQCQGSGIFEINSNGIKVDWQTGGTDAAHYLQTLGMALWLELKQVLCIHANALAYEDTAIALVAPSRTGKTTLTAALSHAGFALMTDDMLALHRSGHDYVIYPSWPVARMWPDTLRELLSDDGAEFNKVHENFEKRIVRIQDASAATSAFKFCSEPKVLSTIYLLNRIEAGRLQNGKGNKSGNHCEIVPMTATRAAMTLIQNSMLGSCYAALGLEQERIKAVAELLKSVKVKQINYSNGIEHLDEVCSALARDVNG